MFKFQKTHPFERRKNESSRIRKKYPDKIPVIVENSPRSDVPLIDKSKYLLPADLTVGQFVYVIRKRIVLNQEKALYVFIQNKILPPTAAMMSTIYEQYKDDDGFLYISYACESTFGSELTLD